MVVLIVSLPRPFALGQVVYLRLIFGVRQLDRLWPVLANLHELLQLDLPLADQLEGLLKVVHSLLHLLKSTVEAFKFKNPQCPIHSIR